MVVLFLHHSCSHEFECFLNLGHPRRLQDDCPRPRETFEQTARAAIPPQVKVIADVAGRNALWKVPGTRMVELRVVDRLKCDFEPARFDFRTCAVVGNGGVLRLTSYGKAIDSHQVASRLLPCSAEESWLPCPALPPGIEEPE